MIEKLFSWPVLVYIGSIFGIQIVWFGMKAAAHARFARSRRRSKLDGEALIEPGSKLSRLGGVATADAVLLLVSVFVAPIVIFVVSSKDDRQGLALAFVILLVWVLVSGTGLAKAFLSGVAFRVYVGFRSPLQIGDRVTVGDHVGRVLSIDPFFLRLRTFNDDQISIPTASLWTQPTLSINAGERSSLVEISFHLSPFITASQRRDCEDALWDAIQRSTFWEFDKPLQIYVEQLPDRIQLTARTYVALTYNELLFKSDVTEMFLDYASSKNIPLASQAWEKSVLPSRLEGSLR